MVGGGLRAGLWLTEVLDGRGESDGPGRNHAVVTDTNHDAMHCIRINGKMVSGDRNLSGETRYPHPSYRTAQAPRCIRVKRVMIWRLAPKVARSR
jgi:hypothetical protein